MAVRVLQSTRKARTGTTTTQGHVNQPSQEQYSCRPCCFYGFLSFPSLLQVPCRLPGERVTRSLDSLRFHAIDANPCQTENVSTSDFAIACNATCTCHCPCWSQNVEVHGWPACLVDPRLSIRGTDVRKGPVIDGMRRASSPRRIESLRVGQNAASRSKARTHKDNEPNLTMIKGEICAFAITDIA